MKNYLMNIKDAQLVLILFLLPEMAFADFPGNLMALSKGVVMLVFPAILLYEMGKAGLAIARKQPDAKEKAEHVALGTVVVLGVNAVWAFVSKYIGG
jgi:hypothetical protein